MNAPKLKSSSAVFAVNGGMRRVHFDAAEVAEARPTTTAQSTGVIRWTQPVGVIDRTDAAT
jgi:hypothetical protein